MRLLLAAIVFHALLCSTVVPDVPQWVATAPACVGYNGESDSSGRIVHSFTTSTGGTFKMRCDPATGKVTIRGKLAGENTSYDQDVAALNALAEALALPLASIKVNTVETGRSSATKEAPTAFLAQIARATYGHLQRPFYATEPPRKAKAPLQYVAHSNEVRVKIYDRGTFAALRSRPDVGNCLRFELHYLTSRRIGAVMGWNGGVTLASLIDVDVYKALAQKLLDSWKSIHLPVAMNSELTYKDLALLKAGQDPAYWVAIKPGTAPATYKRLRVRFAELQRDQPAATANPYGQQMEGLLTALRESAK